MARTSYADLDKLEQEDRDFFKDMPALNVFKMLANAGKTGRDCVKLGTTVLLEQELKSDLRELAIIRTGILRGSEYEVYQHKKIAARNGIPDTKLDSLYTGPDAPAFSAVERMVLKFTEEFVSESKVSDSTFYAVLDELGKKQTAELAITVGYYMLISSFLETFEVDIEK